MNKFLSDLRSAAPILLAAAVLALVFVPVPIVGIEILLAANFLLAAAIFAGGVATAGKRPRWLPQAVLYFCFVALGIAVATTRAFLTARDFEAQIPLARVIGQWICKENVVVGFMSTLGVSAAIVICCKEGSNRIAEVAARFCLDTMGQKTFVIDNELNKGKITQQEADSKRKSLRREADFYSGLDGSAKYLEGTIKAFVWIFAAACLGGVAVGVLEMDLFWKEAARQSAILSCGYLALQIPPLLFASAAVAVASE